MRMGVAVGALFLVIGCSHGPSLVGKWVDPRVPTVGGWTLSDDGTYLYESATGGARTTQHGTYSFEGDTLTFHAKDTTVEVEGQKATTQAPDWVATVKIDGDTMTLNHKGETVTWKRVK